MTLLPPLLLFDRNREHGGIGRKAMTPGSLRSVAVARRFLAGLAHARVGASGVLSRLGHELGQLAELGRLLCDLGWLGWPAW
jgi:hypothetical protein